MSLFWKFGVTNKELFEYKRNRIAEDIKSELALAIRKVKDPRVRDSLINIVKLEFSDKLSSIRVYVSTIKGLTIAKRAASGLRNASGFIKKEIGKNLKIKYMPEFIFIATDSIEYGTRISQKLKDIRGANSKWEYP